MLDPEMYASITMRLDNPTTDLFASRLNKQCPVYASWRPDPDAMFVDAFSANWNNVYFYAFPPFSLIGMCLEKIQANKADGILVVPFWISQSWYPKLLRLLVDPPLVISHRETLLTLPGCHKLHPLRKKLNLLACHLCGDSTRTEAFLKKAINIVLQSWRLSSQNQYDAHINKWLLFCTQRQANQICPGMSVAVEFLTNVYEEGLSYSSINSARCALSAIIDTSDSVHRTFGEHPDVKRFMKGIFQSRPPLPRYSKTRDVNSVLQYISSMGDSQDLSLKDLTLKLTMLVALTTAQRGQSLHLS